MKDYAFVEIVFENCESILIDKSKVEKFDCGNLVHTGTDILGWNSYQSDKILLNIKYTNESDLIYNAMEYDEPLGMFLGNPTSNRVLDRPNILGRIINHSDIVDIQLLDEDNNVLKDVYVPWGEDDYDEHNSLQKVESDNGILSISIKK